MKKAAYFFLLLATGPAMADVPASDNTTDTAPVASPAEPSYAAKLRTDAAAVLKGPDFHQMESGRLPAARPWLKNWLKPGEKKKEEAPSPPDLRSVAQWLKIGVIAVLVLLLGWLLWRGYQWLTPQLDKRRKINRQARPRVADSQPLPIAAGLPDNISDSAARAWQAGQASTALSLLYRGAVTTLARHYQLSLPDGATEGDYLHLVRRRGPRELASSFNTIVQAWMAQAYANRRPTDFPALLVIYRRHFEMPGARS